VPSRGDAGFDGGEGKSEATKVLERERDRRPRREAAGRVRSYSDRENFARMMGAD